MLCFSIDVPPAIGGEACADANSAVPPKIETRGLDFYYGHVQALFGISLSVPACCVTALIGPSGSGKTSLLMLMAGLERASGGGISIDNQPIESMDEDRLARLRRTDIGIVFQAFHLIPTMTALENVAVPLELAGVADAFARSNAPASRSYAARASGFRCRSRNSA